MAKKKGKGKSDTPLMKQYNHIKGKYPDAMLLFRVGDFYETFGDDAVKASEILGIVLTKRSNGAAADMALAGFPHHALDTYLPKLVKAGQKVAICDQLEDPKLTKSIVKRGVTELVTPGVSYNDKILDQKENNFLASLHLTDTVCGVAFLDISTGEFLCAQGALSYVEKLVQSFKPSEVILQRNKREAFLSVFGNHYYLSTFDDWVFSYDFAYENLTRHFQTQSLKGFGVEEMEQGVIAAGGALHYLFETRHDKVQHISNLSRIEEDRYVWLDRFTIRNLELLHSPQENATTLLSVMDRTISPMGSRLIRRWIVLPLKEIQAVTERHDVVDTFLDDEPLSSEIASRLRQVGDLERLISKVATGRINPRELLQVKNALLAIDPVKEACLSTGNEALARIADQLNSCEVVRQRLQDALVDDPPSHVQKGSVFRDQVSAELDELRKLAYSGKDYLTQIQQRESEATGIPSLKIGYNNVFGYYLEVRNTHKEKVPEEWVRKQTLVSSERYITQELKVLEEKILNAEEKILALETRMYEELISVVAGYIQPIQLNAQLLAQLDCLHSFALLAKENGYTRPVLTDGFEIDIKNGRHPVIEKQLPPGDKYVANDVYLDNQRQQIMIITGPNMSGKSALLRQVALIVLMAQMGSFVPAKHASIGLVDKVFTRVGASDNISSGESTFMVEMNETASILNNISNRSLILLDEIGRGTSTYDGISIAWSIAEFLHNHQLYRPKVLFATHYHELNEMATTMKRIKNYHVSVKEINDKVIFLRKLAKGGTAHSFGIHVAQIAGMPAMVTRRAEALLKQLEDSHQREGIGQKSSSDSEAMQLSFIQLDDPLLYQIRDEILHTDINSLTPVEALMKLNEIKKLLGG
ncbi:MAG: DNA mismatch repair protein MutS [Bacteroidetes bacterium]|nr:MAG: DNA mismatch repair protein MutS [Bacteroidota bacterium]